MAEVGQVTPGKPIWPDPHRGYEREPGHEHGGEAPPRRKPLPPEEAEPAASPAPDPGHIDEFA